MNYAGRQTKIARAEKGFPCSFHAVGAREGGRGKRKKVERERDLLSTRVEKGSAKKGGAGERQREFQCGGEKRTLRKRERERNIRVHTVEARPP